MVAMDEEEVVRLFLKDGFQISKDALGLVPEDTKTIISNLKKIKPRPFIITKQHIKKVLEDASSKPVKEKRTKEYNFSKPSVRVDDYVKELSIRYDKIKSLLLNQMASKKLVSINKITPRTTTFSIIGLVREKSSDSILVEDPTGEANLYFGDNTKKELKNISLDDVVGAQCEKIKERYYVKKLFFADPTHHFPLKQNI